MVRGTNWKNIVNQENDLRPKHCSHWDKIPIYEM